MKILLRIRPRHWIPWIPFVAFAISLLFVWLAHATQYTINVGSTANDGTGDSLRVAFQKANSNFTELYGIAGNPFTNSLIKTQNVTLGTNIGTFSFDSGVTGYQAGGVAHLGISVGAGGVASTNGNQFGPSTTLTIKSGAEVTNLSLRGSITNNTAIVGAGDVSGTLATFSAFKAPSLGSYQINSLNVLNDDGAGGIQLANDPLWTKLNFYQNTIIAGSVSISSTTIMSGPISMGVSQISTNSTIIIDGLNPPLQIVTNANTGYNVTLRFTNIFPGLNLNFSLAGPSGSNAVSYIWPQNVIARWPVDAYTDLPTTNTYVRTNCYLDLSIICYATNNVRVCSDRFK